MGAGVLRRSYLVSATTPTTSYGPALSSLVPKRPSKHATDRGPAGEIAPGEGLVDDDGGGVVDAHVAGDERATGQQRDPHRLEEAGSHRRHRRFDRLVRGARHADVVGPGPAEHAVLGGTGRLDAGDAAEPIEHLEQRRALLLLRPHAGRFPSRAAARSTRQSPDSRWRASRTTAPAGCRRTSR